MPVMGSGGAEKGRTVHVHLACEDLALDDLQALPLERRRHPVRRELCGCQQQQLEFKRQQTVQQAQERRTSVGPLVGEEGAPPPACPAETPGP